MNISLVFNISNLTKYHEGGIEEGLIEAQWNIQSPTLEEDKIEEILDSCVGKSTRNMWYKKYLVKWKGRIVEDSSWFSKVEVNHLGLSLTPEMRWDHISNYLECLMQEHPRYKNQSRITQKYCFFSIRTKMLRLLFLVSWHLCMYGHKISHKPLEWWRNHVFTICHLWDIIFFIVFKIF